ncbi:MAG: hypothetical protein EOO10_24025 [Chitinophagaceae bacterium]|nr:hypothetical protein [Flavisolibacter longurius]RYZ19712.1 MAG: hypothetical protein EOO10_24025 [Chitinophagaceae bacterium]
MRFSRNQYRAIYASLIIVAFFIPAYNNISAAGFLSLALNTVRSDDEMTMIDFVIISFPLFLILLTALIILFQSLRKRTSTSLLLGLPLFSLAFFIVLLSFDVNKEVSNAGVFSLLKNMRYGFYIASLASVLLFLSHSRREALNSGQRRW